MLPERVVLRVPPAQRLEAEKAGAIVRLARAGREEEAS